MDMATLGKKMDKLMDMMGGFNKRLEAVETKTQAMRPRKRS